MPQATENPGNDQYWGCSTGADPAPPAWRSCLAAKGALTVTYVHRGQMKRSDIGIRDGYGARDPLGLRLCALDAFSGGLMLLVPRLASDWTPVKEQLRDTAGLTSPQDLR